MMHDFVLRRLVSTTRSTMQWFGRFSPPHYFIHDLRTTQFSSVSINASQSRQLKTLAYDVFVSFRGKDIRDGFLSHLVEAFDQNKIKAFVDDKLKRGNEIPPSLVGGIEGSLISLIIFSQDYASSHWCLEELVTILQCREKHRQIVIPVFYRVDPGDVRHQMGSYENAFVEHGKMYNSTKIQIWRHALKKSANLSGIKSSEFGNDAQLLKEIIKCVLKNLNNRNIVYSKGLIGIDKPIAHVKSLLHQASKDVCVVGIWGMGGIGKTTIAEEIFHQLCCEYEGCCFLANIREESARHGIIFLKEKLFSTLLAEDVKVNTAKGLPFYDRVRIGRMKVLIVLDDVNDLDQLEILVGDHTWFGPGSRIIITTRDKQVFSKQVDHIYEVEALDLEKSLELFNWNAFKKNQLEMEYYELSKRVVNHAKGIPLVLKVLGHLLQGKDKKIWESQLDKLRKNPSKKVLDLMRLSYDDLDHKEQTIFLDIACFFNGLNLKEDLINTLLKDCEKDNSVAGGLERLKDKALISVSKDNVITMHDIIQEMAGEIVRRECSEDPGRRSRLWDPDDIYEVLKNDKGTQSIRSIRMKLSTIRKLKLSSSIFAKMSRLRFLYLPSEYDQDGSDLLPQGLQSMPPQLRYLYWMHYPLKYLPDNFSAEKLVILDLSYSRVEKLWHGVQNLMNLREVKLFFSRFLKELPDFSKAMNLEVLDIHFCSQLSHVHPSIFSLEKLDKLDLSHCTSLTELTSHSHLSSLRYLNLKFCKNIRKFSVTSENMVELDLQSTCISALPASFGGQSKLEVLHLAHCHIESLPAFKSLTRLQYLNLKYCRELQTLPELPQSLEILLAQECTSLNTVFFPSTTEQFKENRKKVVFANCLKLDDHSLKKIELNAQINVTNFAYQHLSHNFHVKCDDYDDRHDSYQAVYVYPGSSVPKWLECKTTKDYVVVDSTTPCSPGLGFIFCFVLGPKRLIGDMLKFNFTISDGGEGEGEGKEDYFIMYMSKPSASVVSDHVCVVYDQQCSQILNNISKSKTRFQIKVTAELASRHPGNDLQLGVMLKGFGVNPITTSAYHKFIQNMGLC